jgi:tetratricopeptide (TPR) repeat protein
MSTSEQSEPSAKRVFISYSQHDPTQHSRRVREFAQALADDGLDVELDQYHQNEPVDWPRWCEERLRKENSDFVLMICSAEYKNRIEGRVAADKGRGVFWEGGIIDDYLYEAKANERFIPILLDDEGEESLPQIVRGWTRFRVSDFGIASGEVGYTNLYRLLTTQPGVIKPKPGERKVLPPEPSSRPASTDSQIKPTYLPHPSLGPLFKGRQDFINAIRAGFTANPRRAQAISALQAIHGLGGIGKTRAAVEYAWRFAADYTALLFVSAETPLDFRTNVAALCPILKTAEGVTDDTLRFDAAIDWLRDPRHRGWLFIVDNLDTPEVADKAARSLATLEGGHVLITGRLSEWPAFVESRRLDVLDPDSATEFLLARTADKRQPHENDAAEARALASELDGLALALEQAAAFIRRHTLSFSDYFQRWRAADQRVREWHDARTMQYERPLATTWQTTIDNLPQAARSLLHLLSWLAPEPLPRFLFDHDASPDGMRHLFEDEKAPSEILRVLSGEAHAEPETALAALRDFSLLQPGRELLFANEGQLHRVVALITRERQSGEEQEVSLCGALALVSAASVGEPHDVRSWPVRDALRPHVRALVGFADEHGITEATPRLMNELGLLLKTKAQHGEAELLFRRALAIDEKSFGPEHPAVGSDLNNLAQLLQITNRLSEAEPLMRRTLAIVEKSYRPEHPDLAVALNNLAELLRVTNRRAEAEPLMWRVLEIFEKAFGLEHTSVAAALNNLAQLLKDTNRLAEAEPLMRRTLAINEKSLGPNHPAVATALNNLGQLLQATNRLAEAEPLMHRALAIDQESFGQEHPDVARDLNNLALLMQATNRLAEAEPLMRRALAIDEKSFGPDHPDVAIELNNLAELLRTTNRLPEAELLMSRVLGIFEKAFGQEHPRVGTALNNLAVLLKTTNRLAEAEPLLRRALAIDEKSFGPDHPEVATDLNNLGQLLQATNRLAEAESLLRRSLVILLKFTRATGHLHPQLVGACRRYVILIQKMNFPTDQIAERFVGVGKEAGFDAEAFRELVLRLSL